MHNDKGITEMLGRFGRYAVPAPAQQLLYARAVRAWLDAEASGTPYSPSIRKRGIRAKQRLTESNLRLVVSVANKYRRVWQDHPERFEDLVQTGVLGLNRAIEMFDPTRGYTFSTYAYWWIRQAMARATEPLLSPIRTPEGVISNWFKLSKVISHFEAEHGHRPSVEWLINETGLSREKIERTVIVGCVRAVASLDQAIRTDNEEAGNLGDFISYEQPDPDDGLQEQLQRDTINRLLPQLSESDQQLLSAVYAEGLNHAQHAAQLGVCRETARKRVAAAVGRLKRLVAAEQQLPIAA